MLAVSLNQVSKKYGRKIGIRGIDLTVNRGDIFGLIGPDNAGKSTILRILMNFVFPSDGEVTVFGLNATKEAKEIKEDIAYVPGEIYFYHNMKAEKYIRLTMKMHHQKDKERCAELIKLFEIEPKEKFEVMDRSDQKKVALAAALSIKPKLLLLDEPTRGLDAAMKNRLYQHLTEMQANGTTIIITGRDAEEIYGLCNRIAIIENGEITVDDRAFALENPDYFKDKFDFSASTDDALIAETAVDGLEDTIVMLPNAPDEFGESDDDKKAEDSLENYKNITMKSTGFDRDAFLNIGAKIVREKAGKIVIEYSGDLSALAKLLYDLNMDDIRISSKDLQEEFLPFYEGGENE
ncbi:MAG TPA: ATP-binding cassette domain-containing protein [Clostridiales bacterium]|nr:ATP-binding cassette domain-containing protein [Clostridiales bacterium]